MLVLYMYILEVYSDAICCSCDSIAILVVLVETFLQTFPAFPIEVEVKGVAMYIFAIVSSTKTLNFMDIFRAGTQSVPVVYTQVVPDLNWGKTKCTLWQNSRTCSHFLYVKSMLVYGYECVCVISPYCANLQTMSSSHGSSRYDKRETYGHIELGEFARMCQEVAHIHVHVYICY